MKSIIILYEYFVCTTLRRTAEFSSLVGNLYYKPYNKQKYCSENNYSLQKRFLLGIFQLNTIYSNFSGYPTKLMSITYTDIFQKQTNFKIIYYRMFGNLCQPNIEILAATHLPIAEYVSNIYMTSIHSLIISTVKVIISPQ